MAEWLLSVGGLLASQGRQLEVECRELLSELRRLADSIESPAPRGGREAIARKLPFSGSGRRTPRGRSTASAAGRKAFAAGSEAADAGSPAMSYRLLFSGHRQLAVRSGKPLSPAWSEVPAAAQGLL